MSTCNTSTLLSNAGQFVALPSGQIYPAKLALMVRILKLSNPSYVLDVSALVTSASCFFCLPPGILPVLKLRLWCNILGGKGIAPTPCVNLIPGGSTYTLGPNNYTLSGLSQSTTYSIKNPDSHLIQVTVLLGGNTQSFFNVSSDQTSIFTGGDSIVIHDSQAAVDITVNAIVCPV